MQLFKAIACINPLRFAVLIFCGWKMRKFLTIIPDLLFLCFAVEAEFKDGPKSFIPGVTPMIMLHYMAKGILSGYV